MKIDDRIEWGGIWLRGFIENTFSNRRMFFLSENVIDQKSIKKKIPSSYLEGIAL